MPENPIRKVRQLTKVLRLVAFVDAQLAAIDLDIVHPTIADKLAAWTSDDWMQVAMHVGIRPPSEETVYELLTFYRTRAVLAVSVGMKSRQRNDLYSTIRKQRERINELRETLVKIASSSLSNALESDELADAHDMFIELAEAALVIDEEAAE